MAGSFVVAQEPTALRSTTSARQERTDRLVGSVGRTLEVSLMADPLAMGYFLVPLLGQLCDINIFTCMGKSESELARDHTLGIPQRQFTAREFHSCTDIGAIVSACLPSLFIV